ncbi:MAG: DUF1830 domain-containing protein [Cyanobacteriota bacterium]|nr:DUF1830 domain-containing protein [Cyanobacteriota bacterium]
MLNRHYRNDSPQLVILRCIGASGFFLEKVIFPWEDWIFEAPAASRVEIWTYGAAGVELRHAMEIEELPSMTGNDPEWGLDQPRLQHPALLEEPGRGSAGSPSAGIAVRR